MEEVCRICRAEATDDEPLYHPCRCSGSIKYVHQECLLEWLKHSAKGQNCELCHTKYTFSNVYEPDMPEELPLIVHAYHFLTLVRRASHYVSLLGWIHVWYFALAICLKYALELSTIYGSNLHKEMPYHSMRTLFSRIAKGRSPVFEAAWPYRLLPNEVQHAVVRGTWALIAAIVAALVFVTVSTWTTEDPFFRHEIEHLEQGELGPIENPEMDQGDDDDVAAAAAAVGAAAAVVNLAADVAADIQDGVPMEANAARLANAAGNFGAAAAEDDDLEDVDDLFEGRDEDGDDDDMGGAIQELWLNVEAFVGAPWPEQIVEIVATLAKMSLLIIAFYGMPHALGRMHLNVTMYLPAYFRALWSYVRGRPANLEALLWEIHRTELPNTVTVAIGSLVLGYADIAGVTYIVYRQFFDTMLADESYRGVLVSMVYLLSTVKVLCVVVVEMILFPIFCGVNLHIALLPLQDMPWRVGVELVKAHPYRAGVSYWASGLLYMSLLAGFLAICRKFLRPGVLYFVQDPSDPRHQPIRTILVNGLVNHLRKVALSAVMYSCLILGGVGAACVLVRFVLPMLYPIDLSYNFQVDDLRLWPFAVMLYIQYRDGWFSRRRWARTLRSWLPIIFRRCSDFAGISHFLFAVAPAPAPGAQGNYVRAPSNDYFRMRKNLELFVPVSKDDRRLDGVEGVSERELASYTLVWRPRYFWLRVALFMCALWAMLTIVCGTLVLLPLCVGNLMSSYILTKPVANSLVSMLVGQAVAWAVVRYYQQFVRFASQIEEDKLLAYRTHVYTLLLGFMVDASLTFPQLLPEQVANMLITSRVPVASYAIYGIPLLFRKRGHPTLISRERLNNLARISLKLAIPRAAFSLLLPLRVQRILVVEARSGFILLIAYLILMKTGAGAFLSEWSSKARDSYYSRGVQLKNLLDN